MGIELGRISGPLLARDLVRKNSGLGEENLAFETNLLFLDVINGRVGINTDAPSSPRKLDVSGTTGTNDLLVPTQFSTPNFVFSTDRIQNLVNKIYIQPDQTTDPKIAMTKIGTANLRISDQLIENITNNSDITFDTNGTGITEITSSELYVDGDLHATGNITWDGDITFGNNNLDNVEFNADINSHIIPNINQIYDLGTASKRWSKLYTKDLTADSLTYSTITINDINLLLTQGNTIYVSVNGNDSYVGDHLHNTYRTIKYALSQATAGDTVVIFPGTYEEIFPLTVPAGVTVNGAGIRAVTVKPTVGTETNNAFLLNGESTVTHLTVKDFKTSYAFSFASGMTVTSRSPYVQNITVIPATYENAQQVNVSHNLGYPTRTPLGFEFNTDGTVLYAITTTTVLAFNLPSPYYYQYVTATTTPSATYTLTSNSQSRIRFKPDGTRLYISEQNRLRQFSLSTPWDITTLSLMGNVTVSGLGDIQFNSTGTTLYAKNTLGLRIYALSSAWDITAGLTTSTNTLGNNINSGFCFDSTGSLLYTISFSSDTIKVFSLSTPWNLSTYSLLKTITVTSGISSGSSLTFRIINDLFYTSSTGFMYVASVTTSSGNGALVDGSLANSSSREASMLFHSVTLIMPDGIGVHATNGARVEWLDCFTYFANKGIYLTQGTLGFASLGVKYGAELRSIGSANVYGTYGAVADGADTLAYLISHNFAYIGTGTDTTNDPQLVIQSNEVVESNGGRIHYESVDHKGDFRIGNIFYVNQETGAVVFDAQAITFSPTGSISLEGPTSNAFIDYSVVQVGNIRIHDNNIDSLSGPVNFLANSGTTYLNTNVFVTGNTNVSADIAVDGNLFLGNQSTDTITVFSNLTQNLVPDDVGGPFDLGSLSKFWRYSFAETLDVDGVTQISGNTISTLTTDTDLVISSTAPTFPITIWSSAVLGADLTVGGNVTVVSQTSYLKNTEIDGNILLTGAWNQTGNTEITGLFANNNIQITGSSYFEVSSIKLYNSEISATATNDNLNFVGLGTGGIVIDEKLKFKDSTISNVWTSPTTDTQKSVILQPNGTGSVVIDATNALTIPVGNLSTRTIGIGEIRYNNVTNIMEGGGAAGLISFNGLYDSDRNTYIRAGATDNTIYFGINGTELADLNSTRLYTSLYYVDNISLSSNTINNRISGNDLIFAPNGTGNTVLDGVAFGNGGNTITNLSSGALTLTSTGIGFVKFTGTGGLVLPRGTSAERRLSPEIGETRYNTTDSVTEVYSGDPFLGDDGWIPAIGTSGEISAEDVLDLLEIYTLVLG